MGGPSDSCSVEFPGITGDGPAGPNPAKWDSNWGEERKQLDLNSETEIMGVGV